MLRFRYLVWLGHDRKVPTEIYTSLVSSLFSDPRTYLVGGAGSVAAALFSAWKTADLAIILCTVGIVLVTIARAFDMQAFGKVRDTRLSRSAAIRWELRYVVGASAFMALLGAWCFIAFYRTDDHVVQLLAFSVVIAQMVGVAGRNFGSKLLVDAQALCAGVPLMLALIMRGNAYLAVLACVLIPFFLGLRAVADRLRRTLLAAVVATRDVTLLAGRFDTALNNMPHGLCMFDPHHRLVVANKRVAEMLGLAATRRGDTLRTFLRGAVNSGMLSDASMERLLSDLDARLSWQFDGELAVDTADGRSLALTFEPMPNGGSVVLVEDVTDRKNAEAKINHLARYDALTGLPNRSYFHDQMAFALSSMKRDGQCAILFIDLDQFKQVNDTLGHPTGDALLCAVSQRLLGIVRDTDLVARFGGDEFVVLQSPIRSDESASVLARRIVDELSTIYEIEGHNVVIGASVGIAIAPRDGRDADLLLKNADMALYRAKADGRGQWRFFEPEMDAKVQARRSLELDLRQAVATGTFELHYQPLVNLKTGQISTCEALLRWTHPERGPISPAEFIPIAEEVGLIVEIGHWVLRRACTDCARWPGQTNVAVNLSPIQFRHGNIMRAVKEALSAANLPPNRLEIEITESVLLQDTETTRAILRQMHDHGVKVSLDDFGTGYSSLSYLHSFPLDKVKIDRSFLAAATTSKRALPLLRNVARLIAELGMWVTMEGVETKEQLELITAEGNFDEAQGWLFSPAVPAAQIEAMLDPSALRQLLPKQARKVA